jgi:hypothetical protein
MMAIASSALPPHPTSCGGRQRAPTAYSVVGFSATILAAFLLFAPLKRESSNKISASIGL